MALPAQSLPTPPRLALQPRSALLARVEALLASAGMRLDRLDPPPSEVAESAPVLPLRLLSEREELLRADR